MSIELVVFDLDGTLIDPHREAPIRPRVLEAIRACPIETTLATGRTFPFAAPVARTLQISNYLITSQGAVVAHSDSGEVLCSQTVPEASQPEILQWCRDQHRVIAVYEQLGQELRIWQNFEKEEPSVYDHLFGKERQLSDLPTLDGSILKFIVMNEPELPPEERTRFEPEVVLTRTHHRLVEGTAAGVNKGAGLKLMLEALRVDPQRVLVVGDNDNDVPMFRVAGHSVAMGNAPDSVKAEADWVAPSIEEDGAAVALERYLGL